MKIFKHFYKLYLIPLITAFLFPNSLLAQLIPVSREIPESVEVIQNIEFVSYDDIHLMMDLYLPKEFNDSIPVIVLIQGGGFENGEKETFAALAAALAKRGLAAASIDYRGIKSSPFPASVHDVKAAIRWLRINATEYSLNSDAIGALGGSYGGLMSVYAGLTSGIAELEGPEANYEVASEINAVVGFSALIELESMPANLHNFLSNMLGSGFERDSDLWRFASPLSHVDENSPPVFLIASNVDTTVPFQQSLKLVEAYGKSNLEIKLHLLPKAHHAFWNYTEWFEPVMDESAGFFHEHLD